MDHEHVHAFVETVDGADVQSMQLPMATNVMRRSQSVFSGRIARLAGSYTLGNLKQYRRCAFPSKIRRPFGRNLHGYSDSKKPGTVAGLWT
jgi:hypothetical protein